MIYHHQLAVFLEEKVDETFKDRLSHRGSYGHLPPPAPCGHSPQHGLALQGDAGEPDYLRLPMRAAPVTAATLTL